MLIGFLAGIRLRFGFEGNVSPAAQLSSLMRSLVLWTAQDLKKQQNFKKIIQIRKKTSLLNK